MSDATELWGGVGMMTFRALDNRLDATELLTFFRLANMLDATELLTWSHRISVYRDQTNQLLQEHLIGSHSSV